MVIAIALRAILQIICYIQKYMDIYFHHRKLKHVYSKQACTNQFVLTLQITSFLFSVYIHEPSEIMNYVHDESK